MPASMFILCDTDIQLIHKLITKQTPMLKISQQGVVAVEAGCLNPRPKKKEFAVYPMEG